MTGARDNDGDAEEDHMDLWCGLVIGWDVMLVGDLGGGDQ